MSTNLLDGLRRIAKTSSHVELSYGDAQLRTQVSGSLIEILDDGVLIDCDGAITFIRADQVLSFRVLRVLGPLSGSEGLEQLRADLESDVGSAHRRSMSLLPVRVEGSEPSNGALSKPIGKLSGIVATPSAISNNQPLSTISDPAFALFSGPIMTPVFEPDFLVSGIGNDDRGELVRWKNRYDYA